MTPIIVRCVLKVCHLGDHLFVGSTTPSAFGDCQAEVPKPTPAKVTSTEPRDIDADAEPSQEDLAVWYAAQVLGLHRFTRAWDALNCREQLECRLEAGAVIAAHENFLDGKIDGYVEKRTKRIAADARTRREAQRLAKHGGNATAYATSLRELGTALAHEHVHFVTGLRPTHWPVIGAILAPEDVAS